VIRRIESATGEPLRYETVLIAFTSDLRSRRRLARLALAVATATNGWVDVDGDISRPYGHDRSPTWHPLSIETAAAKSSTTGSS
jgi:hypothetical protein